MAASSDLEDPRKGCRHLYGKGAGIYKELACDPGSGVDVSSQGDREILGNIIPVFFIQDAIKCPDLAKQETNRDLT